MKKALMNASVASMIYKFNMNNIDILEKLGYQVDVACNFGKENPISQEEISDFRKKLKEKNIKVYETTCPRSILAVKNMWTAYKQLKTIADNENYELVHTQSPIGGVVCRLAFKKARKKGTKVIYQAHGFHFYKGAPLLNWLLFYPIEKFCSRFTDVLITINKEDYEIAKKKFHAKRVEYVPGVGVNIESFSNVDLDKEKKRIEVGIPGKAFLILSVGELNDNKNHVTIIKALGKLKNPNIYYAIAGQGYMDATLRKTAKEIGIEKQVKLFGFRSDVNELYHIADVFCFPSKREGLGLGAIEAMISGLPLLTSNVHGINDYSQEGITGFKCSPLDIGGFANAIQMMYENPKLRSHMCTYNKKYARKYDVNNIIKLMNYIYESVE